METLNVEQEACLRELIAVEERGESVAAHVDALLMADTDGMDEGSADGGLVTFGGHLITLPGFDRQTELYRSLVRKGMLDGTERRGLGMVRSLTTDGRTYFTEKDAALRRRRDEIWGDRRFQIGLSIATLLVSSMLGWASGCVSSRSALQGQSQQSSQQPQAGQATGQP